MASQHTVMKSLLKSAAMHTTTTCLTKHRYNFQLSLSKQHNPSAQAGAPLHDMHIERTVP